jgi:hypothetical protein
LTRSASAGRDANSGFEHSNTVPNLLAMKLRALLISSQATNAPQVLVIVTGFTPKAGSNSDLP